jgi:hypothetical protein
MWGRRWRSCAVGALLLALAGCSGTDMFRLNFWQSSQNADVNYNGAQYVSADLEVVAQSAKGVLDKMGIEAVSKPSGDHIVLNCTTKQGTKFVLFLERFPQQDGVKTRIDLAWETKPDETLRIELLAAILALHPQGAISHS